MYNKKSMYCDNIVGVAWVYWIIYSRGVVQYIQRREAPRDILLNPEGVYYPIYPCHAHYIITICPDHNRCIISVHLFLVLSVITFSQTALMTLSRKSPAHTYMSWKLTLIFLCCKLANCAFLYNKYIFWFLSQLCLNSITDASILHMF